MGFKHVFMQIIQLFCHGFNCFVRLVILQRVVYMFMLEKNSITVAVAINGHVEYRLSCIEYRVHDHPNKGIISCIHNNSMKPNIRMTKFYMIGGGILLNLQLNLHFF